ncbi:MAG: KUP/HAK/KT family potassium transporter [Alphaproteobacteria bacterium]|nr:KUP/HAK/KT family potassium transporter [Alphaproteobacteria bacterium]
MSGTAPKTRGRLALSLGALGVVYGDIGTSPLYAMRECFVGVSGFPVSEANVLGILSLITWSLVVVVSLQFVLLVLRADNQGEGGLLALAHLIVPDDIERWTRTHGAVVALGLFGAALLFGDGVITPALSVLSAMEGLRVAAPTMAPLVVPLTVGILFALFALQRLGTARVGRLFGPVMLAWFATLGALGVAQLARHPEVLVALDPRHAVAFFRAHGLHGTLVLGAVFLAVTGAEALYADLGHFGRRPIQRSWFGLVFPCLLLNYFGQGALLLEHPEQVGDVFYHLAPRPALLPLIGLATAATIIASQAVISGVFSLTAQAVRLRYLPRAEIRHTSAAHWGQRFVPAANRLLLVGTLALVIGFRSSGDLADAYGIAVSLSMAITTLLMLFVMRDVWRWPVALCVAVTAALLAVELAFFGSVARKIASGGWIPLTIAVVLALVMGVWRRGQQLADRHPPDLRAEGLDEAPLVVLVRDPAQVPADFAPGREVILLHVNRCHSPYMTDMPHGQVRRVGGRPLVDACFGFMESPDVPALLRSLRASGALEVDEARATYVLIRETFHTDRDHGLHRWLRGLFGALARRAARVSEALGIPPERVVEVPSMVRVPPPDGGGG